MNKSAKLYVLCDSMVEQLRGVNDHLVKEMTKYDDMVEEAKKEGKVIAQSSEEYMKLLSITGLVNASLLDIAITLGEMYEGPDSGTEEEESAGVSPSEAGGDVEEGGESV